MERLDGVSAADLRTALGEVTEKRATQRLMVAIAYKHGTTQTELAEWYGIERKTVYNWLTRFEERPGNLVEAARDDRRPGRPRKLDGEELDRLEATLRQPPQEAGYDAPAWTPALVRRHVAETFDREYSLASCRRLLREAGLRYRSPARLGIDESGQFCAEFEESAGGWTSEPRAGVDDRSDSG